MSTWNRTLLVAVLLSLVAAAAHATITSPPPPVVVYPPDGVCIEKLYISITPYQDEVLGVTFQVDDIICIDVAAGSASLFWHKNSWTEDLDAVALCPDGKILLSTRSYATLPKSGGGTLGFQSGDVVKWNPVTNTASMFFNGSDIIGTDKQLDGFEVLPDGTILFSLDCTIWLNGTEYEDEDVIAYDSDAPAGSKFSMYFEGDEHGISKNLDAIAILCNGDLVFSLDEDICDPIFAESKDLILYSGGVLTRFLDTHTELGYGCDSDIDALEILCCEEPPPQVPGVPEPLTMSLFGISVLSGLAWKRRRQA